MKTFIIKKSFFVLLGAIAAIGTLFGILAGMTAADAAATDTNMPTIVIDAGHGGIDNGVVGIESDTDEADINLAIARLLRTDFANAGFKAVMTRYDESGLYGSTTKGFKARDMQRRREIIEENDADMVISIHQNFCPLPSRRGGIVFYDKDSESGKSLADCIQNELNSIAESAKPQQSQTGDYYMLKCTESPSVIVECGFLSNAEDDRLLNTEEYREKVAYAIYKGAITYFAT